LRDVRCSGHVHRNAFLALRSAQALKWASFISLFQAYFRKIFPFLGDFRYDVFEGKHSTLSVSFVVFCDVGVGPCFGVLPWKRG
jgi:hypothetical protein